MKTGETLSAIAEAYKGKFSYPSLLNHCKKHQFLNEQDFTNRHLNRIVKKAESDIVKKAIESSKVWDKVIDQGMEALEEGSLQINTGHLLKAAKDKQDFEFKKKDQQLAMMEMVWHFAAGENHQEINNPYNEAKLANEHNRDIVEGETVPNQHSTAGTPEDAGRGTDQPRGIHYPPAWNAAA